MRGKKKEHWEELCELAANGTRPQEADTTRSRK
jgi:hypothetical protein